MMWQKAAMDKNLKILSSQPNMAGMAKHARCKG